MLSKLSVMLLSAVLCSSVIAADKWTTLSNVGPIQLQADISSFTYSTTVNGTLHVNGGFRMLDITTSHSDVSKFWVNANSCAERGGTLNSILIPGSPITFRPWSASGNTLFDVVGISLCKYHIAVVNVIKSKELKKKDSI